MPAVHVRNVPESVLTALRERAAINGQSMQAEIRQVLAAAAEAPLPRPRPEPVRLTTVRAASATTWSRREIYDETGR
ncbi:plasmid stability protein stbC [uncultured Jatrophihabitans sp.]|uniref:FitA-like ribbon-helix-helix domain-containing protein n=1 Tax=uncultured Jatrophihabitans sp. TaxID=1610747 RepID=UPI0035CC8165